MANPNFQVGGSFAPSLDDAKLNVYRELVKKASPQVAGIMTPLIDMIDLYNDRPAPKKGAKAAAPARHPVGLDLVVPLPKEEVDRLWDAVPWDHELEMYGKVFDGIDPVADKPLRDAAHHLLWYARELFLDREPITKDKVEGLL